MYFAMLEGGVHNVYQRVGPNNVLRRSFVDLESAEGYLRACRDEQYHGGPSLSSESVSGWRLSAPNLGGVAIDKMDAIEAALGPEGFRAFCRGNIIKHTWWAGKGSAVEADSSAVLYYAERLNKSLANET